MNIEFLFPQFVYTNLTNMDTKSLEKYCYELKNQSEGRVISNVGGWQSNGLTDESLFFNHIIGDIKKLFQVLQIHDLKLDFHDFWINVNGKNDYNVQHNHIGGFISGVLYVKTPENCGNIFFVDPLTSVRSAYEYNFHVSGRLPLNNVFSKSWCYEPKEGLLILFPSWLEHYVEPNKSDEDRISIAFNIGVKP